MGDFNELLAAVALLVVGHLILSSIPVREAVMNAIGEKGFRVAYGAVAIAAIVWIVFAYGRAPYVEVWYEIPGMRHLTWTLMFFSILLVVLGNTTKSPTALGGEGYIDGHEPLPGILRVTRHPFLWGTFIWAIAHLLVNGDVGSIILMVGIAILSIAGMFHIDYRREKKLGSAWGPIRMRSSLIPFGAIIAGRTKMDWGGIGIIRPAIAVVVYLAIFKFHEAIFGVAAVQL